MASTPTTPNHKPRRLWRLSIFQYLVLVGLGLTCISLPISTFIQVQFQTAHMRDLLAEQVHSLHYAVNERHEAGEPVSREELHRMLELFSKQRFIDTITVMSPRGDLLMNFRSRDSTQNEFDARALCRRHQLDPQAEHISTPEGVDLELEPMWLLLSQDESAVLCTVLNRRPIDELRNYTWKRMLPVGAFACTLAFIGILLLVQPISRSIREVIGFTGGLRDPSVRGNLRPFVLKDVDAIASVVNSLADDLYTQRQALMQTRARLQALFESSFDGILSLDQGNRVIEFNPAAARIFGQTLDGVTLPELLDATIPDPDARRHVADYLSAVREERAGRRISYERERIETVLTRSDGHFTQVELSARISRAGGEELLALYVRDITDRVMLELERKEATDRLRMALDELQQQKSALDQHAMVNIIGTDGRITYSNKRFAEVSGYKLEQVLGRSLFDFSAGIEGSNVYQGLADIWGGQQANHTWHGEFALLTEHEREIWLAMSIVPFYDQLGNVYQYICIGTDISEQKKSREAIAQLRENELSVRSQIQDALLQGRVPERQSHIAVAALSQASTDVDGDFYDFIQGDDRHLDIVVGDVMGKGIPAALIGAGLKQMFSHSYAQALARTRHGLPTPGAVMTALHAEASAPLIQLERFTTVLSMRLDAEARRMVYANAGHLPPIVFDTSSGEALVCEGGQLPVGVRKRMRYSDYELHLPPQALVLSLSDGVTEAQDEHGNEFGLARVIHTVRAALKAKLPLNAMLWLLRNRVVRFSGSVRFCDDFTIVAARLQHEPGVDSATLQQEFELPSRADQIPQLRRQMQRAAQHAALSQEAHDQIELALVEAFTNIVRHAHLGEGRERVQLRLTARPANALVNPSGNDGDSGAGMGSTTSLDEVHEPVDEFHTAAFTTSPLEPSPVTVWDASGADPNADPNAEPNAAPDGAPADSGQPDDAGRDNSLAAEDSQAINDPNEAKDLTALDAHFTPVTFFFSRNSNSGYPEGENEGHAIATTFSSATSQPVIDFDGLDTSGGFVRAELFYTGAAYVPPSNTDIPSRARRGEGGFGTYLIFSLVDHVQGGELLPGLQTISLTKLADQAPKDTMSAIGA